MNQRFYSHGKLLITGEYAVLDGALCLAIPTKKGQTLTISPAKEPGLQWKSFDSVGKTWFEASFGLDELTGLQKGTVEGDIRSTLLLLLQTAKRLNPAFINRSTALAVETHLEFPRNWGLGSSSTLISNLAVWAEVDAYELQRLTFGGSGYDIACATSDGPLLYQRWEGRQQVTGVAFDPPFADQLYFVHLNRKQDSQRAVASYREVAADIPSFVDAITAITREIVDSHSLSQFENLLLEHEKLVAEITGLPTAREAHFPDYPGCIKSLGAWGGDFILATGGKDTAQYFRARGFNTVLPYLEMTLKK